MVLLSNPPVEDAAIGEADKSLRYAQKITRHRTLADKSSEYQLYASLSRYYNGACPDTLTGGLFFSHALILSKNPHLWMDTSRDPFHKELIIFSIPNVRGSI
jgi:hypothetical protein